MPYSHIQTVQASSVIRLHCNNNNNNWIHVETYLKTMMLSLTPPSPPAPTKVKKA